MEEYKPNSHRYRELEKRKVEKIVTGAVRTRKKSGADKFVEAFVSEDAGNVKNYIITDLVIPTLKKLFLDTVYDGLSMLLTGTINNTSGSSRGSTAYYRAYDGGRTTTSRQEPVRRTVRRSYDDVVVSTRGEAEDVLASMDEMLDIYGTVRVSDFLGLVGLPDEYTDNDYGWTNLRTARVDRVSNGFLLRLPVARPLK